MHRWLLLLLLGVAACRDSGASLPTTTTLLPDTTASLPPTTTAPGFEIPAVIDLPYVQRVLETIYHLDGEAKRYVYAKQVPDAEFNARLEAIFGGPALDESKRVIGQNAAERFVLYANPPGDARVTAVEIVQATQGCMIVRSHLDFRPVYREERPPQPIAVIQLRSAVVSPLNPTGWGVVFQGQPETNQDIRVCK